MKYLFAILLLLISSSAILAQNDTCPEEQCFHSAKFWQTYNCFAEGEFQVPWSDGGLTSSAQNWAATLGLPNVGTCDLRFGSSVSNESCLTTFQGTNYLLMDLSESTDQVAIMIQNFYLYILDILFIFQNPIGLCPVGFKRLPSDAGLEKRLTQIEINLLLPITSMMAPFLQAAADSNCDFYSLSAETISDLNEKYAIDVTCQEDFASCEDICVNDKHYWKTNKPWPLVEGSSPEDNVLCGTRWEDWLQNFFQHIGDFGIAQIFLARQWITAHLNLINGACLPDDVLDTMYEVEVLLGDNCDDRVFAFSSTGKHMLELASELLKYNNGLNGPMACE